MLTIHCDTAQFQGAGHFTCAICRSRTDMEDLSAVLISLPEATALFDAETGTLLHDCRHVYMLGTAQRQR